MRLLDLRTITLLTLTLGLTACPGDDGDDSGEESGASTTMSATTSNTEEGEGTNTVEMTSTTMGEEGTTAAEDSTGELILADIEVMVTYEGMETGLLNVVALTSWPPAGPPVAAASEMDPAFPWSGTLNDLEAGEWYVAAVLDVGADNPTVPGPEDLVAVTEMPVVVDGPGPFMVELTLMDPM